MDVVLGKSLIWDGARLVASLAIVEQMRRVEVLQAELAGKVGCNTVQLAVDLAFDAVGGIFENA